MKELSSSSGVEIPSLIPSLDGLRAVSIMIVFLSHAHLDHVVPGGLGVTIFFFISGFLITTLLFRELDRFGSISLGAFYLRRALRIMPPLLITLGFAVLLAVAGVIETQIDTLVLLSQVLFFFNYLQAHLPIEQIPGTGIIWSLAVEEHFYFIFPFVFLWLAKSRRAIAISVLILLAFLGWRTFRFLVLGSTEMMIYLSSDTRLDSLYFGCFLSILMYRGIFPWNGGAGQRPMLRNALLAASALLILISVAIRDPLFRSTLRYSLQGLALMPLFYYAVTQPNLPVFRPLNWSAVRYFGVLSYSFYLVHHVIFRALETRFDFVYGVAVAAVLTLVLSTLYAAAMHRFVETPIARMRKRLTGHRQAPAVAG